MAMTISMEGQIVGTRGQMVGLRGQAMVVGMEGEMACIGIPYEKTRRQPS